MRRALTLTETLIAAMLIGLMLVMVALGVDTVRVDLKRRQTEWVLAQLDRAMIAYHRTAGHWPTDPSTFPSRDMPSEDNNSGDRIIATLGTEPESRKTLDKIPPAFRTAISAQDAAAIPTSQPWGTVHDAWGRQLRCLTSNSPASADRDAVAANDGKPIFISAGPDENLGRQDPSAAADNIRSDGR